MIWSIKISVVLISLYVFAKFAIETRRQWQSKVLSTATQVKLAITGFVANISDTIGLGSFAVVVAFDKHWKLVDDQKLPGTLNAHSILPAMCQALFFLQVVRVETFTLFSLVAGATIGGFFGGFFVSRLNKQAIRLLMLVGYTCIALLIIAHKLNLLPVAGDLMGLDGLTLGIGFIGMLLSGALPAIGVGAYAPTQVFLFLLGMSPIAAFPIMTAAGAIQQSVAAFAFVIRKQVAFKESLIMGLAGVAGVFVAAPFITAIDPEALRWLLLAIVVYNVAMLWKTYRAPAIS